VREKDREQSKRWRAANREHLGEYERKRNRERAEYRKAWRRADDKRKAEEREATLRRTRPLRFLVEAESAVAKVIARREWEKDAPARRAAMGRKVAESKVRLRQRKEEYWAAHPEEYARHLAERTAKELERKRSGRAAYKRSRRARMAGAEGRHTVRDVRRLLAMQTPKGKALPVCWWCSHPIRGAYHVDHRIALASGGSNSPDNLVISCPDCNTRKRDLMPWEFSGRLL
jgi:5-methylcytosine-specific restriction endonuclease McrA